jgi:hypothetical protein
LYLGTQSVDGATVSASGDGCAKEFHPWKLAHRIIYFATDAGHLGAISCSRIIARALAASENARMQPTFVQSLRPEIVNHVVAEGRMVFQLVFVLVAIFLLVSSSLIA